MLCLLKLLFRTKSDCVPCKPMPSNPPLPSWSSISNFIFDFIDPAAGPLCLTIRSKLSRANFGYLKTARAACFLLSLLTWRSPCFPCPSAALMENTCAFTYPFAVALKFYISRKQPSMQGLGNQSLANSWCDSGFTLCLWWLQGTRIIMVEGLDNRGWEEALPALDGRGWSIPAGWYPKICKKKNRSSVKKFSPTCSLLSKCHQESSFHSFFHEISGFSLKLLKCIEILPYSPHPKAMDGNNARKILKTILSAFINGT